MMSKRYSIFNMLILSLLLILCGCSYEQNYIMETWLEVFNHSGENIDNHLISELSYTGYDEPHLWSSGLMNSALFQQGVYMMFPSSCGDLLTTYGRNDLMVLKVTTGGKSLYSYTFCFNSYDAQFNFAPDGSNFYLLNDSSYYHLDSSMTLVKKIEIPPTTESERSRLTVNSEGSIIYKESDQRVLESFIYMKDFQMNTIGRLNNLQEDVSFFSVAGASCFPVEMNTDSGKVYSFYNNQFELTGTYTPSLEGSYPIFLKRYDPLTNRLIYWLSGGKLFYYDLNTMSSDFLEYTYPSSIVAIVPGKGYLTYIKEDEGIYGFSFISDQSTELWNKQYSDIDNNGAIQKLKIVAADQQAVYAVVFKFRLIP